eukprot:11195733-Alexandrium_andersonii.AAC.1
MGRSQLALPFGPRVPPLSSDPRVALTSAQHEALADWPPLLGEMHCWILKLGFLSLQQKRWLAGLSPLFLLGRGRPPPSPDPRVALG